MKPSLLRKFLFSNAFIVATCAILIAVVWTMVGERLSYEQAQAHDRARGLAANVALGLESHAQSLISQVDSVLLTARHEYLVHKHVSLRDIVDGITPGSSITSVAIIDHRGRLVSGIGPPLGRDHAEGEYLTHLAAAGRDELAIGRRVVNVKGTWAVDIARRMVKADGSFVGVIAARVDMRGLARFYEDTNLGRGGTIRLVHPDGAVVLRITDGQFEPVGNYAFRALKQALETDPERGQYYTRVTSGVRKLMVYRKMRYAPLIAVAGISEGVILKDVTRDRPLYYSIAAAATIALLGFAIMLIRARADATRTVKQLTRSERRYRAAFDQAFVGMVQAGPDGKTIEVNQRLRDMLTRPEAEILGVPLAEFIHPEDRAASTKQKRILLPDGGIAWAEISTTEVRDIAGDIECVVTVVQDITEFKRADRMKSEFVSIVSHELRTPLTSIRGSLGLISGGVAGALPDAARGLVDIAKNNSERLIRLINDILDIEKIESGKMRFEMREAQLVPLAERVVTANEALAQQYGVRLRVEACEQPLLVNVDPDRLEQVLTNLISNATKFAPRDSDVTVRLGLSGDRVRVEVIDRGPGIPIEFRSRIFQKFSQADSSDTRMKGGTGLGLNICKAIVERLGGMIGFTSTEGEGTTFFFELPELGAPEAGARDATRPQVLVCEDDPDTARVIAMMLANAGYGTDIAHTVSQARDKLAAHHYDAMTVDIRLPDGSGLELIGEVRRAPATASVPVVVVSAFIDDAGLRINGETLAVCDWLDKPIDESRLIQALARGIEGKPRVLHVEPDREMQCRVAAAAQDLAAFDFACGVAEARDRLTARRFDAVALELELDDGSGRELLRDLSELESPPSVIILSCRPPTPAELRHADAVLSKDPTLSEDRIREAIATAIEKRRQPLAA